MDCGNVSIGSLSPQFLLANLIVSSSVYQTVVCYLVHSSKGTADVATPTAQAPDGCGERDLFWSQHIPGWIRTGNQSRYRIWLSLVSFSNPAATSQRHLQHFLLQLVWPCFIEIRLWVSCKSRTSCMQHTFSTAAKGADTEAWGYKQNSSVRICKLIQTH